MADSNTTHTSRSSTGLAFIVGALVVAVGVLAYAVWGTQGGGDSLTISVEGADSAVEKAAEAVSGN